MSGITINLDEVCGNNIYSRDDGHVLYDKIAESLKMYDKVIVQFNEKEIASESFLDEAIVEHYLQQPDIADKIVLHGVTMSDQILIRNIYVYRKRLEAKEAKKAVKNSRVDAGASARIH